MLTRARLRLARPARRFDRRGRRRRRMGWVWLAALVALVCHQELGVLAHAGAKAYVWVTHVWVTHTAETATSPAAPGRRPPAAGLRGITTTTQAGCEPAPDLASPQLDPRVRQVLAVLAGRWRLRVCCVHTGHASYVAGTRRVSNHAVWRAVDVDQVDGAAVSAANPAARDLVGFLAHLRGPLRPAEVGSPFQVAAAGFFSDDGHRGHVHIGYGPSLGLGGGR